MLQCTSCCIENFNCDRYRVSQKNLPWQYPVVSGPIFPTARPALLAGDLQKSYFIFLFLLLLYQSTQFHKICQVVVDTRKNIHSTFCNETLFRLYKIAVFIVIHFCHILYVVLKSEKAAFFKYHMVLYAHVYWS